MDTHYLYSRIEPEPEMDLDKGFFGTTVIHSDTYEWSKYYPIVHPGVIEQSPSKELKAFSNNVLKYRAVRDLVGTICYDTNNGDAKLEKPTFQTMAGEFPDADAEDVTESIVNEAARFGMSAGKLYIYKPQNVKGSWKGSIMSGFWLDKDFFITCAHGLARDLIDTDREICIRSWKRTERLSAFASVFQFSSNLDEKDRPVYLLDSDDASDVAIFAKHPTYEFVPNSIKMTELSSLPTNSPVCGKLRQDGPHYEMPLWTVGYSGANTPFDRDSALKEPGLSEQRKNDIENFLVHRDTDYPGDKTTYFDYHLWKYGELLKARQNEGTFKQVWEKFAKQAEKGPEYSDIFYLNLRALAVGIFKGHMDSAHGGNKYTRRFYHDMSGFHGNSGSMVCFFLGGDKEQAKVLGVFTGDWPDGPYNHARMFTPDGLKWIKDVTDAYKRGDPASASQEPTAGGVI